MKDNLSFSSASSHSSSVLSATISSQQQQQNLPFNNKFIATIAYTLLCSISYFLFLNKVARIIYLMPHDQVGLSYYLLNYFVSYIVMTLASCYMIKRDFAITMRICSFIIILGCMLNIFSKYYKLYYKLLSVFATFCFQNSHPVIINGIGKMSAIWYEKTNVYII